MNQRDRMCGKSPLSPSDAWRRARGRQKYGDPIHAYHCPWCGRYHVGCDQRLTVAYAQGAEEARS